MAGWVLAATGDETGERGAAGRVTGWIPAEVEAPAEFIGFVGEGGVFGKLMKENDITGIARERDDFFVALIVAE